MPRRHIRIVRCPLSAETLELAEEATVPEPGPNEVRIRVLAAGTGFTGTPRSAAAATRISRVLRHSPGYDLGEVEQTGSDASVPRVGQMVANRSVTGGYSQRPAGRLWLFSRASPREEGIDPAEAVCVPLAVSPSPPTKCLRLPQAATGCDRFVPYRRLGGRSYGAVSIWHAILGLFCQLPPRREHSGG